MSDPATEWLRKVQRYDIEEQTFTGYPEDETGHIEHPEPDAPEITDSDE